MKEIIQKEAVNALIKHDGNSIITAATGVGKTKIAIDYIKTLDSDISILLVVPTEKLRDKDWKDEFIKWGAEDIWNRNITRCCYASLNKFHNEMFELIILDELQNITPNNAKYFSQNMYKKIIGLTATLPLEQDKRELLFHLKMKVVYNVPIEEAVENKLVAPFEITIVEVELDKINMIKKSLPGNRHYFTTEYKEYNRLNNAIDMAKLTQDYKKMERLIFTRMRLIYNSTQKTLIAKHILNNIIKKDEKVLIFCGSIKQAEDLCDNSYHSKSSDKNLERFRKNEILKLSCVNALNEGVNLPNIDVAIITQVNSKERNLVQKIGRIIRYRKNHIGQVYIIVVKNTVDEKWLNTALSNFENISIKTLKL